MLEIAFLSVRPDRIPTLEGWMDEISRRRDESLETFRREGTRHEVVHLLHPAPAVLVYAMELEDSQRAHRAFADSRLPIDVEHKRVMREISAGPAETTKLFDLRQPGL